MTLIKGLTKVVDAGNATPICYPDGNRRHFSRLREGRQAD